MLVKLVHFAVQTDPGEKGVVIKLIFYSMGATAYFIYMQLMTTGLMGAAQSFRQIYDMDYYYQNATDEGLDDSMKRFMLKS